MYKVLVGIDYGDKRAEPGDFVDDVPKTSVKWMLEQGILEEVEKPKVSKTTRVEKDGE